VGKHEADQGTPAHPLVMAALAQRVPGTRRHAEPTGEGGLGWPDPATPGGGGLGWPGDESPEPADGGSEPVEKQASSSAWRGWRRFLGLSRVA
jgi:hypothetical protein